MPPHLAVPRLTRPRRTWTRGSSLTSTCRQPSATPKSMTLPALLVDMPPCHLRVHGGTLRKCSSLRRHALATDLRAATRPCDGGGGGGGQTSSSHHSRAWAGCVSGTVSRRSSSQPSPPQLQPCSGGQNCYYRRETVFLIKYIARILLNGCAVARPCNGGAAASDLVFSLWQRRCGGGTVSTLHLRNALLQPCSGG